MRKIIIICTLLTVLSGCSSTDKASEATSDFFAMGYDAVIEFLSDNQDICAFIIRDDDTVYFNEELADSVTLIGSYNKNCVVLELDCKER